MFHEPEGRKTWLAQTMKEYDYSFLAKVHQISRCSVTYELNVPLIYRVDNKGDDPGIHTYYYSQFVVSVPFSDVMSKNLKIGLVAVTSDSELYTYTNPVAIKDACYHRAALNAMGYTVVKSFPDNLVYDTKETMKNMVKILTENTNVRLFWIPNDQNSLIT